MKYLLCAEAITLYGAILAIGGTLMMKQGVDGHQIGLAIGGGVVWFVGYGMVRLQLDHSTRYATAS